MMKNRGLFVVVLFAIALHSASGETLAVTVRLNGEPDEENRIVRLLSMVEEGMMDTMFDEGHIVFDIEVNDDLVISRFDAIDGARNGGARYLLIVDTSFKVLEGLGLVPAAADVTVVEVRREEDKAVSPVDALTISGVFEKTAEMVSRDVGHLAATTALQVLGEASW